MPAAKRSYDELCETWEVEVPGLGTAVFYGVGHHLASALVLAGLTGTPPVLDGEDRPGDIRGFRPLGGAGDDRVGFAWDAVGGAGGSVETDGPDAPDPAALSAACLEALRRGLAMAVPPDHPDLDEALDSLGLTGAERIGVEVVAAMKAHLYSRDDPDASRRHDVLHCLLRHDPGAEDDVRSGAVDRARVDAYLDDERDRLLDQAAYVGDLLAGVLARRPTPPSGG